MANIQRLQRYWQQWGAKLEPLVKSKSARLLFPAKIRHDGSTASSETFSPERPVCIFNAPAKASARRGKSYKLAIFIDGNLRISVDADNPCISHRANVTIFRITEVPGVSLHLEMVDAMHFDVDTPDERTGLRTHFHPIFHVQRGPSLDDDLCKAVLAEIVHLPVDKITVDQSNKAALGTPYLRIPTPQLDMFAVLTLVAADYFCNPGDAHRDEEIDDAIAKGASKASLANRSNVKALFVALLDLLRHQTNLAREGHSSVELRARLTTANVVSSALWYPESA